MLTRGMSNSLPIPRDFTKSHQKKCGKIPIVKTKLMLGRNDQSFTDELPNKIGHQRTQHTTHTEILSQGSFKIFS